MGALMVAQFMCAACELYERLHGACICLQVPTSLTQLTNLLEIGLGGNHLSGVLPPGVCALRALQGPACDLSKQNFTCPLPPCAAEHCAATCINASG